MNLILSDIIDYVKYHCKIVIAGIIVVLAVVAIVFTLPIITITNETTQIEYSIEMSQESYVENEPLITTELVEKTKVIATGLYKVVPSGVIIPFSIEKVGSTLVGQFDNSIPGTYTVLSDIKRIIWETKGAKGTVNLPLPPGNYYARFREDVMWGEECRLHLAIQWSEIEQVTRYQQVVKYREVPNQVEKQKTVTTEDKISVWKHLFSQP
jgi:hypothetical protein